MGKINPPLLAEKVLPQKPPMSLLGHVIAHDSKSTLCELRIRPNTLFLANGRVEAWVGLEYMAQAVAAHAGMVARGRRKPPKIGFLIGARRADFFTKGYLLGQTLHVAARHVWGEGELFAFDCSIKDAAKKGFLAKAQLNVFRPRDLKPFLNEVNT